MRNIINRNRWQAKKEKERVLNIICILLHYRMSRMQKVHTGSKSSWAFLPRIQPSTAINFKVITTSSRNLWVTSCWRLCIQRKHRSVLCHPYAFPFPCAASADPHPPEQRCRIRWALDLTCYGYLHASFLSSHQNTLYLTWIRSPTCLWIEGGKTFTFSHSNIQSIYWDDGFKQKAYFFWTVTYKNKKPGKESLKKRLQLSAINFVSTPRLSVAFNLSQNKYTLDAVCFWCYLAFK